MSSSLMLVRMILFVFTLNCVLRDLSDIIYLYKFIPFTKRNCNFKQYTCWWKAQCSARFRTHSKIPLVVFSIERIHMSAACWSHHTHIAIENFYSMICMTLISIETYAVIRWKWTVWTRAPSINTDQTRAAHHAITHHRSVGTCENVG